MTGFTLNIAIIYGACLLTPPLVWLALAAAEWAGRKRDRSERPQ